MTLEAQRVSGSAVQRITDAYLFCGQSNVGFRGVAGDLPAQLQNPQPNTQYWCRFDKSGPIFETTGIEEVQPIDGFFGPEITFAQSFAADGLFPLIVKIGAGSTSLAVDWLPFAGGQYTNLLTRVASIAAVFRIRGIYWVQGEADAQVQAQANAYLANLSTFCAAVRGLGPHTKSVHAYISRLRSGAPFAFTNTVRTAQETWVSNDSNATLINTDDLPTEPDEVHFNSDGLQTLGARFRAAAPPLAA